MTPDQWFAAGTLLFIVLAVVTIRRAWHEWLGIA